MNRRAILKAVLFAPIAAMIPRRRPTYPEYEVAHIDHENKSVMLREIDRAGRAYGEGLEEGLRGINLDATPRWTNETTIRIPLDKNGRPIIPLGPKCPFKVRKARVRSDCIDITLM